MIIIIFNTDECCEKINCKALIDEEGNEILFQ